MAGRVCAFVALVAMALASCDGVGDGDGDNGGYDLPFPVDLPFNGGQISRALDVDAAIVPAGGLGVPQAYQLRVRDPADGMGPVARPDMHFSAIMVAGALQGVQGLGVNSAINATMRHNCGGWTYIRVEYDPVGFTHIDMILAAQELTELVTRRGFFGAPPVARPTIVGAKAGNVALANLLTGLANLGLIVDNTGP